MKVRGEIEQVTGLGGLFPPRCALIEFRNWLFALVLLLVSVLASSAEGTRPGPAAVTSPLLAQAQSAEIPADKMADYHDVTNRLDALQKEEKDLVRRGYRDDHPLIQAVRSQLRELSSQKAELEHPAAHPVDSVKPQDQIQPPAGLNLAALTPAQTGSAARAPVSVASGRSMDSLDDKQKLGVGDRVTFRVLEDQEDPKPLTVTDAGELDVPELGLVAAAGKTCKQLAFEIKPKLEQTTYYHATIIIGIDLLNKTMSGRRAYVSGQVQKTGAQEIPAGETWTVTKAIMRAGGFTDYADKKHVRLVRAASKGIPGKTFLLNIDEVLEKGRTDLDLSVEPEDLIYVPARAVNF